MVPEGELLRQEGVRYRTRPQKGAQLQNCTSTLRGARMYAWSMLPAGDGHGAWSWRAMLRHPWAFPLALLAYFALLFAIRAFLFSGAAIDEAEELFFAQKFEAGYMLRNPPLFTWLVILLERVGGVSTVWVVLIRFTALFAAYAFLYRCAGMMTRSRLAAVAAAISPFAIHFVGWRLIRTYTHSALLLAACAAVLWALLRLERSPRRWSYVVFGVAVGAGALSKYNFLLFLLPLLAAALFDGRFRSVLLDRRIALSAAVAAALVTPHVVWLAGRAGVAAGATASHLRPEGTAPWEIPPVALVLAAAQFALPLILLMAVAFRGSLTTPSPPPVAGEPRYDRLLSRMIAIQLASIAFSAVSFGFEVRPHHLVVLVAFPLWFFAAYGERLEPLRLRRYVTALATLALLVPAALIVRLELDPKVDAASGRPSHLHVRYEAAADELRRAGFDDGAIIASDEDYILSGNLRPYFPDARFLSSNWPGFTAPDPDGDALFVWAETAGEMPGEDLEQLMEFVRRTGTIHACSSLPDRRSARLGVIDVPLLHGDGRTLRLAYLLLDADAPAQASHAGTDGCCPPSGSS
jgi:lipopolysaccharide core galacturonosyltransferase RgtB